MKKNCGSKKILIWMESGCVNKLISQQYLDVFQILAADIPVAESLELTSTPGAGSLIALPHSVIAESVLKRDEWMLMPTSAPAMPAMPADLQYQPKCHERPLTSPTNDAFTEDYGELSRDSRTTSGGVDFFSSLGTERKKISKPILDKVCFCSVIYVILIY